MFASKRPGVIFIVDEKGRLEGGFTSAGFLERSHNPGARRMTAGSVAKPCKTVILTNASLDRALKLMTRETAEYLPVVDDIQTRKVVGVLHRKDLDIACRTRTQETEA